MMGIDAKQDKTVDKLREVIVNVPARLHPTVLDMNRFNLNRPGGGGLGFAVEIFFNAKLVLLDMIPAMIRVI